MRPANPGINRQVGQGFHASRFDQYLDDGKLFPFQFLRGPNEQHFQIVVQWWDFATGVGGVHLVTQFLEDINHPLGYLPDVSPDVGGFRRSHNQPTGPAANHRVIAHRTIHAVGVERGGSPENCTLSRFAGATSAKEYFSQLARVVIPRRQFRRVAEVGGEPFAAEAIHDAKGQRSKRVEQLDRTLAYTFLRGPILFGVPDVELVKQPSWAVTRDNLQIGSAGGGLDGAMVLSPMPYHMSIGTITVNNKKLPMYVVARMNTGGQGISLGNFYRDDSVGLDASKLRERADRQKAAGNYFQT